MSFLRHILLNCGGFSPRLGRKGTSLLSCEESELFYRLGRSKMKVLYEPTAVVYHNIDARRASPAWVLQRSFAQGRSKSDPISLDSRSAKMRVSKEVRDERKGGVAEPR